MANVPKKIIVHHSADVSKESQLWKINRWHQDLDFPKSSLGYFVGYHYLVQRDGTIIKTREDFEIGAHDKGENVNSLGVCLEGNFDLEYPSLKQEESLGALLTALCNMYKLTALDIEPHRIRDNTHCYGLLLSDRWAGYVYLEYQTNFVRRMADWLLVKLKELRER